jgi:hypothetical protein
VLRFNAVGPDGLIEAVPPGGAALLNDARRQALAQIVESGSTPSLIVSCAGDCSI